MSSSSYPVVVFNDTRVDRHHGCNAVMRAIETLSDRTGFDIIKTSPAHHDWENDPAIEEAIRRAKLLIVNGEGTIHHDREAGRRLLRVAQRAREEGIPSVLLNAGWEANGPEFQALVKHFTLVSVRDSGSAGELREVGADCRIVPDLSLYSPAGETGTARGSDVGFVDSVDRFSALDIDRLCMKRGGRTLSIFYPEPGVSGYLGFIRQGVAKSDLRSPATFARLVRMRHRIYRGSTEDTDAFLRQLSGLRLLVSGRFHACTLALLVDTPFVALTSNTRKIESLIRDAGLEKWRCATDVASIDIDAAVRQGWSAAERESTTDYIASSRDSAERLFREMRALLQ